jgi:hypothetical protein
MIVGCEASKRKSLKPLKRTSFNIALPRSPSTSSLGKKDRLAYEGGREAL